MLLFRFEDFIAFDMFLYSFKKGINNMMNFVCCAKLVFVCLVRSIFVISVFINGVFEIYFKS